jgi:hypothetical protein
MERDSLSNEADDFIARLADGDASGQIRHMGSPTRLTALDDHHVPCHSSVTLFLGPACFRITFNVPGGISRLGLPVAVTVPGLLGFLNCR